PASTRKHPQAPASTRKHPQAPACSSEPEPNFMPHPRNAKTVLMPRLRRVDVALWKYFVLG
ncbi:MAG: hypothetical protein EBS01_11235, partial [Verrucomicrobia bacterium]|nr:hypothetical protein [Verrucomicrobiota bacterium]